LAEAEADRVAFLLQLLRRRKERVPGPVLRRLGRGPERRIHLEDVDADLLEQVEPRAGRLHLRAGHRRHAGAVAALAFGEVLRRRIPLAVHLRQLGEDVVHRLEEILLVERVPGLEGEDVVPRTRLRLGGGGEHDLVALAGDVVDLEIDILLFRPVLADLGEHVVRARDPVIPEADRERAGGVRGADVRERERGGGGGGGSLDERATSLLRHAASSSEGYRRNYRPKFAPGLSANDGAAQRGPDRESRWRERLAEAVGYPTGAISRKR